MRWKSSRRSCSNKSGITIYVSHSAQQPNAHQCSMNRNRINADYYINWARRPRNRLCIHIRCLLFTVHCSLFTKYICILLDVFKIEIEALSGSVRTIISSTFNLICFNYNLWCVHSSPFTVYKPLIQIQIKLTELNFNPWIVEYHFQRGFKTDLYV